jgi:hypothetical protein
MRWGVLFVVFLQTICMANKIYSETDALYDIFMWQLPVPFVLAVCFSCQLLILDQASLMFHPNSWMVVASFISSVLIFWAIVVLVILILDLLLLTPMFALLRLGSTLYLRP